MGHPEIALGSNKEPCSPHLPPTGVSFYISTLFSLPHSQANSWGQKAENCFTKNLPPKGSVLEECSALFTKRAFGLLLVGWLAACLLGFSELGLVSRASYNPDRQSNRGVWGGAPHP